MPVLGAILLGVAALVFWGIRAHQKPAPEEVKKYQAGPSSLLYEAHDRPATLYLRGVDGSTGQWTNVPAVIRLSQSRLNQLKQLLQAYLKGSREGKKHLPIPPGLGLNEVFWTSDNIVVVDVSSFDVEREKVGFWEELLFVRGLIETVSKNFYEVKQVKILVNGRDGGTLAGHYALGTAD